MEVVRSRAQEVLCLQDVVFDESVFHFASENIDSMNLATENSFQAFYNVGETAIGSIGYCGTNSPFHYAIQSH